MQTTKKEFDEHQKHLKRTHTDGSQYLTSFFLAFPVVSPLLVSFALFLLQSNGSIFLVTDSHLFFSVGDYGTKAVEALASNENRHHIK